MKPPVITGLFETHLYVSDLELSIKFYKELLGLQQCYFEEDRRAAFFWIGAPKQAMLGLWEKPVEEIDIRHFAFSCTVHELLDHVIPFLKSNGLNPYNFLKDGTDRPMVFTWMPALSVYFKDPDGHVLEYIANLEGEGRDGGIVSYEEWLLIDD